MTEIPSPESMTPDFLSPIAAAKRRAAGLSSEPSTDSAQDRAIHRLANDLHRLNRSVMEAVEAGVSIELVRTSRHHCGNGHWGDMMVPVVVKR